MPFLKEKVRLAQPKSSQATVDRQVLSRPLKIQSEVKATDNEASPFSSVCSVYQETLLPCRRPRQQQRCSNTKSKNLVKNYGRAFCAFSCSETATPYIIDIINKEKFINVDIEEFRSFVKVQKDNISSMNGLRELLIVKDDEVHEEKIYKSVFQQLSIIFIKFFSVNWIYNGKLMNKDAHLKVRFKMLRRVKNPEYFTYLSSSAK